MSKNYFLIIAVFSFIFLIISTGYVNAITRLYVDEYPGAPYTTVTRSYHLTDVDIDSLTPDAFANINALIAATYWDFSNNSSTTFSTETRVPRNASETCASTACGFVHPGVDFMSRIDTSDGGKSLTAIDFDGVNTFYLRA